MKRSNGLPDTDTRSLQIAFVIVMAMSFLIGWIPVLR